MRGDSSPENPAYSYNPSLTANASSYPDGRIEFSSILHADEFNRAHELAHKISSCFTLEKFDDNNELFVGRIGLMIVDVKKEVNKETGETHNVTFAVGRGLNEGVTNLIASKLSNKSCFLVQHYRTETYHAQNIAKRIGEDIIIESALFDPQILENQYNLLERDETSYFEMIAGLDNFRKFGIEPENKFVSILNAVLHPTTAIKKAILRRKQANEEYDKDYDNSPDLQSTGLTKKEHRSQIRRNLREAKNIRKKWTPQEKEATLSAWFPE